MLPRMVDLLKTRLRHLKEMFMRWREDDVTEDGRLAEDTA
jgi:hypothetical protein